jgi:predicted dienelactone hydrolase
MSCGYRSLKVHDTIQNIDLSVVLFYPAFGEEQLLQFGPYSAEVAQNAPLVGDALRQVVISHGNSGTPWAYRDLAKRLAQAGFVVLLPEHHGNSRHDNSLAGTAANLLNRPRHISLALDVLAADPMFANRLASARVGIIGHSIGGYTALALAGGRPWSGPHENQDGKPHPVPVAPDIRVGALVLLTPAVFWFVPESLRTVQVPILLRTGEKDEITPPLHAAIVLEGVFDLALVDNQVLSGAGHFSVMSKFPLAMTRPDFPPSQDPPGCNREAIHLSLYADIETFLKRVLCV